uniref:BED-type domain-containing protein n=1 Tax=Quercus lobata TaxID=97700 RepID=A0A7N2RCK8_QUELO
MGRPKDEAWDMVDPLHPRGWKCRHCSKSYPSCSSVTRVKRHLAQTGRGDISPCPTVPKDVRERARHLLGAKATAVTARHNELPIQKNEIHQMQTQNHATPTGSWQAVPNYGVHPHQYRENTESYELPIQTNEIRQMQTQNHATPTGSWQAVPNYGVHAHQYRENTESYELLIQTNEIHQMQTQNHATPTGSWQAVPNYGVPAHQYRENTESYGTPQVQAVAVPNYGVPAHQYWEDTESYGTLQVQPVAVSHPVGEPNHQNENCAEDAGPQVSDDILISANLEDFNDEGALDFFQCIKW